MGGIIIALGALQIAGGVMAYAGAASAIHQILGSISFGMGILSIALGIAIKELSAIRRAAESQTTMTARVSGHDEPLPDMSRWSQRDRDKYLAERQDR